MPRRPARPRRKRRNSTDELPRQRPQKPIAQPTMMVRARIVSQLDDVIGSCEDLFAEHGEDCSCENCAVVSNAVGSVRIFQMLLSIT